MTIVRLPAAGRPITPWKNGGGATQEIAAFPPGAGFSQMEWRTSIATVTQPGSFSHFEGINRSLSVLSGCLELRLGGKDRMMVSEGDQPVLFPGELDVEGRPLDGPVTDLNVMTRRGLWTARVESVPQGTSRLLQSPAPYILVVATGGAIVTVAAEHIALTALDAIMITAADHERIGVQSQSRCFVVALGPAS